MRYFSPLALAITVMLGVLGSVIIVLWLAVSQPSLGLDFSIPDEGKGLIISAVDAPELEALSGARLVAIGAAGEPRITITSETLLEEPDKLNDGALIRAFREEQGRIRSLLSNGDVVLYWSRDDRDGETTVKVQSTRPISDLPFGFWAQLITGVAGVMIGGWIWAQKPKRLSHIFLFLTGVGLQLSAFSAALYSGRELALSARAYEVLAPMNAGGALLFGAGLVGLFLRYPRPLAPAWASWLPLPLLCLPLAREIVVGGGNPVIYLHGPIVLALTAILISLVAQWIVARHDPVSRAALKVIALGVVMGAGGFVVTTTLPALLGLNSHVSQAHSFLLFLLVFGGVALAVRRYRFFDLEQWSFKLMFYIGGALVLILLDAFLVFALSVERQPAFGVALLVVTLGYLPLRDTLKDWVFTGRKDSLPLTHLVRTADGIALTRDRQKQEVLWRDLLQREFSALSVDLTAPSGATVACIEDEGAAMIVPAVPPLAEVRLRWKDFGRRLFSSRDAQKAQDIVTILTQMVEARQAFVAGMNEERERITRDMHDNIGIRLTTALTQSDVANKNDLIRETFSDIRKILSHSDNGTSSLGDILADLRVELTEYLDAQGIAFDWPLHDHSDERPSSGVAHALRSMLRESVHNAARHSGADCVRVRVEIDEAEFRVTVSDTGRGLRGAGTVDVPSLSERGGNGLANLRRRVSDVGGRVTIMPSNEPGFRISATLPFTARYIGNPLSDEGGQQA
ncbi:sensor histidine kinase [Celeribacter sp.]|uniref:ATP-binding protein n=1 Tax=Celeribacter sp. TaxID=1890673 RepID=UPI003A8E4C69